MTNEIIVWMILSQSFVGGGCVRAEPQKNAQSASRTARGTDSSRVWRVGSYRGLTMGRSKGAEVRKKFGEPKRSQLINKGKSNEEVWYEYDDAPDFPGSLRVIVDRRNDTIQAIDIHPKDLKQEQAITHFGSEYVLTRYDFDSCLGDEESAPLFESPTGAVLFIEYRQYGIAIAVNSQGKVNEISYVSEPVGAAASRCK